MAAVLAATLPSTVLAVVLMQTIETWQDRRLFAAALVGTVAAVTGMMWSTVWMLVRPYVRGVSNTLRAIVLVGGAAGAAWLGITPIPIILVALVIGVLWTDAEKP
jgi:chromate transport protein ChrA